MEYRRLGSTGLFVSRLGLGCGNFGGIGSDPRFFGEGEDDEQAFALMDRAFDAGINFFDTADAYGGGRSETIIGKWLATKPVSARNQLLVSTKAFNAVGDGPNDRGLSRRHLKRQVEASLNRLGVERLDMFLIHEPEPGTPLQETLAALDDLVRAGKIHYIGASNIEAWRTMKALAVSERCGYQRFAWVQNNYSLLERGDEKEMLPLCAEEGLGYTPFSPLAGGWLTGKYRKAGAYPKGSRMTLRPEPYGHLVADRVFQGIDAFEREAKSRGVSMSTLAHAWTLTQTLTTAVITGPRQPEQLDEALAAVGLQLSAEERGELTALF